MRCTALRCAASSSPRAACPVRYQVEPGYQFDTPLPATAGDGGNDSYRNGGKLWGAGGSDSRSDAQYQPSMGGSIGDLAPKGL